MQLRVKHKHEIYTTDPYRPTLHHSANISQVSSYRAIHWVPTAYHQVAGVSLLWRCGGGTPRGSRGRSSPWWRGQGRNPLELKHF